MKLPTFQNEPMIDFAVAANRHKFDLAVAELRGKLGGTHDLVIGGKRVKTANTFVSTNPSRLDEVLGHFAKAEVAHVDLALEEAWKAFASWSRVAAKDRVSVLVNAARLMRERRYELLALLSLEVGKNPVEADAELGEAVDFCEFYAREMLRLDAPQPLTRIPSEDNELRYIALGAGAVIPPWNFPLAILAGMAVAAIVAGNTVVLKPSSDAPAIAWAFFDILEAAGMPPGVVNLLTGPGGAIGDRLVESPRTRFVTFTGSKSVGLRINHLAAATQPGQRWVKRVVCELGGKNAIIVDRDADLDAAVQGVVASAYGYTGQKCSACSRAIVDTAVYEAFLAKLAPAVARLAVGAAEAPGTAVGPLINRKSRDKTLEYIATGRREGRHIIGGEAGDPAGCFVTPAVFADVAPGATIAQEEIFGPVLAVIKARDFDDALAIANDTEYGLTGSVYTTDRDKVERAKNEFFVGNLYINRKSTGALVDVHPFGGFNMSGTDSKAGGRDYLLLFLQAKAISEKVK